VQLDVLGYFFFFLSYRLKYLKECRTAELFVFSQMFARNLLGNVKLVVTMETSSGWTFAVHSNSSVPILGGWCFKHGFCVFM